MIIMKYILPALVIFLLLASPIFAQITTSPIIADNYNGAVVSKCLTNDTLMKTLTVYRCVNNDCSYIVANATQVCQYGCNPRDIPNICNPSPQQSNYNIAIMAIAIILILVGAFWWLLKRR